VTLSLNEVMRSRPWLDMIGPFFSFVTCDASRGAERRTAGNRDRDDRTLKCQEINGGVED
jgi:hypothetical protein